MNAEASTFLFGKLPAHGDFVARGLSEPVRQAWDDWASAALEQLHSTGPDFEAAHDCIPPWRFVAGPSALGDAWRVGALAPSVDGAGRRFVIVAGADGWSAQQAGALGAAAAAAVEDVLYQALSNGLAADAVVDAVNSALDTFADQEPAAEALAAAPSAPGAWWSAGTGLAVRSSAAPPVDLFAACAFGLRETAA